MLFEALLFHLEDQTNKAWGITEIYFVNGSHSIAKDDISCKETKYIVITDPTTHQNQKPPSSDHLVFIKCEDVLMKIWEVSTEKGKQYYYTFAQLFCVTFCGSITIQNAPTEEILPWTSADVLRKLQITFVSWTDYYWVGWMARLGRSCLSPGKELEFPLSKSQSGAVKYTQHKKMYSKGDLLR